jgi:RNA polymerase sigma-70 factor (ECF subfamily)
MRCISVRTLSLVLSTSSDVPAVRGSDAGTVAAELFDLHAAGLYRLASAMLHDGAAAEDVVQDTFVRLIAHVSAGGALPNARGWLYTVAAHCCRDRQRRSWRWLPWRTELDRRPSTSTPDARDGSDAVLHAIRTLPERDRLLVVLRAHGLSYGEIAAAANINPASVGRLLTRALDRLARQLGTHSENAL